MNQMSVPKQRVGLLLCAAVIAMVVFMTVDVGGDINYILRRRSWILLTMLIVAFASSGSTLMFQIITHNPIVTPAIMGFEALFILVQTFEVFFFEMPSAFWLFNIIKFIFETILLTIFILLFYRIVLNRSHYSINILLMTGIILGGLFRSISGLLQRLLDPNEFAILQSRTLATFSRAVPELILFSLFITVIISMLLWRNCHQFDLLGLGRNQAVSLGINYRQKVTFGLFIVSILVAISTMLVGPLTFLGLVVTHIAYRLSACNKYRYLFMNGFLIAIIALVAGQLILEHVLNMSGSLSIVIEFFGGLFFLYLILNKVLM